MKNHNISPLQPTTPRFSKENHAIYLDILEEAINSPNNKNIGIIGKFGTGKSSIIEGFLKKHPHETAIISIPSFNGNVPAHSESANDNSENQHNLDENLIKSSHLQKEVIKQLFYSKYGKNTPLKYDKIYETSSSRKIFFSFILGTLLWTLSWIIQFPQKIYDFFSPFAVYISNLLNRPGLFDGHWLSYIFFIPFITAIIYSSGITEKINKIAGMQVSGISLSFRSPNYFDENTEQILYFFKKSKVKYVVFEDLDRFRNIEILEQLKYLNTIVNNMIAGGLDSEEETIHFIYTLDDAIYLKLNEEKSDQTIETSLNKDLRNKFFDISFSVVPHISPLNSRGIINEYLREIGVTATEESAIKSLSTLINDNRLAINIVNDFKVYNAQLSKSTWFKSSEQQANILAMLVAYKNLNPSDFNSFVSHSPESNYHMIRENFEKFVNEFSEEKSKKQFKKFKNLIESTTYTLENEQSYFENLRLHDSLKESAETILKIHSSNHFARNINKIESLISNLRESNIISAKDFDILSDCIISTQEILSKNLALKLIMLSDTSFKSEYSLYCVSNSSADQTYDTLAYLFGNLSTVDKLRYSLSLSSVEEIVSYEPSFYDASSFYNPSILKFLADQENNYSFKSAKDRFSNKFRKDILILTEKLEEIFNLYWNIKPLEWDDDESSWINVEDYKELSSEIISTIQDSDFGSFINETFNYFDVKEIFPLLESLNKLGDNLKINSCIRYILSCLIYAYQIDIDYPDDSSLVRYPDRVFALLFFSLISTDAISSEESEFGNFYAKNHTNTDLFYLSQLEYVDDFLELPASIDMPLSNLEEVKKILSKSTYLQELISLGHFINDHFK